MLDFLIYKVPTAFFSVDPSLSMFLLPRRLTALFSFAILLEAPVLAWWLSKSDARRKWVSLSLLVNAVALVTNLTATFNHVPDDSYIHYRIAESLLTGKGYVWSVGQPPVEGAATPLWHMAVALGALVGIPTPYWGRIASLLSTYLLLFVCYLLGRKVFRQQTLAGWFAFLVAANPTIFAYASSGMETNFFLLLVCLAFYTQLSGRLVLSSLIWGAALATRPDTIIVWVPAALYLAYDYYWRRRGSLTPILQFLVPFGIVVCSLEIFRYLYFGEFVPHVVLLKESHDIIDVKEGILYMLRFVYVNLPLVLGLGLLLSLLLVPRVREIVFNRGLTKRRKGILILSLCISFVNLAVVTVGGGDWMPASRYYISTVLFALLLTMILLDAMSEDVYVAVVTEGERDLFASKTRFELGKPIMMLIAIGTVFMSMYPGGWPLNSEYFAARSDTQMTIDYSRIGALVRTVFPSSQSMYTFPAGALPYFAQTPEVRDALGLFEREAEQPAYRVHIMPGHKAWLNDLLPAYAPDLIVDQNIIYFSEMQELDSRADAPLFFGNNSPSTNRYLMQNYSFVFLMADSSEEEKFGVFILVKHDRLDDLGRFPLVDRRKL